MSASETARFVATVVVAMWTQAAFAQSPPSVTDADLEHAKGLQPAITEQDIERAQQRHRMPSEAELQNVPVPSTPNIDALPQRKTRESVDLEAIAKGFNANSDQLAQPQPLATGTGLLVFVSFAMPRPTLERLVDQAEQTKAVLVLRGFVNGSLKDTALRVQNLIGSRNVAFQIDPQAFDRFAISKTPTFVLVRDGAQAVPCASGQCFSPDAFVATAGDVSLDYALEHIQRAEPRFAQDAERFLARIR